jgi:hypothetical protein
VQLVHYVTFHNAGTFRPLHDQLNNIRQQNGHNPLNFVGALDIRPARYANGNQVR